MGRGKGTFGKSSIKRNGGSDASQLGNAPLRAEDSSPSVASSSDILYGDAPRRSTEQAYSAPVYTPDWWPRGWTPPLSLGSEGNANLLSLDWGYFENLKGYSGTEKWLVKSESLPAEWVAQHRRSSRLQRDDLAEAEAQSLLKYIERVISVNSLSEGGAHPCALRTVENGVLPVFDTNREQEALDFYTMHRLAAVEALAAKEGEWYVLKRAESDWFIYWSVADSDLLGAVDKTV